MKTIRDFVSGVWGPAVVYGVVALLILLPLLGPGYILTLDMVFTPRLPMPSDVTSSYLFHVLLHVLNIIIPSQIIEKFLLFAILLLSGLGAHRLMRFIQSSPATGRAEQLAAYASGLFYMINPYTYSRFMAGQYSVLLGYACLPFFVEALLRFLQAPRLRNAVIVAAWMVGISVVSIHTLGLAAVIGIVAVALALWRSRHDAAVGRQIVLWGAAAALFFVVASSYWLVPLLHGTGQTATAIDTFRTTSQSAFATVGKGAAGKLLQVLRLQGFWGERQNLYLLPQDSFLGMWWAVFVLAVWSAAVVGVKVAWRQGRAVALLLIGSLVLAALLAAGVGTSWLANHVALFAGYREPQKFAGVVALCFAVFIGFALQRVLGLSQTAVRRIGALVLLAVMICGFTPVMFGGFDGQLSPRQYPSGWHTVAQHLDKDHSNYQVLVLPWHLYMHYRFAGRIIANPAPAFFEQSTLISNDPELDGATAAIPNAKIALLTTQILPQAHTTTMLGRQLAPLGVKYIVLAKDFDYRSYDYLRHQTDLQPVTDTPTMTLYRNTDFGKE